MKSLRSRLRSSFGAGLALLALALAFAYSIADYSDRGGFDRVVSDALEMLQGDEPEPGMFEVAKVVDGDTISIVRGGKTETIRLIGLNTPETVDPRRPVECFGKEASDKAKELLGGRSVRIETDPTQGERDKYMRLLAYVWRDDGLFFNEYMITEGYGFEYTYNVPYKHQVAFKAAQASAKEAGKGLWAQGVCEEY